MEALADDPILQWFLSMAYQPWKVYLACTLLLLLSSFGLPVPEEGRQFGARVRASWLGRLVSPNAWARAESWTERHGGKVCWVFRFTPGIRFPAHLTCGLVKVPLWQFCLADGVATLVSVPTQILLIAYHGDVGPCSRGSRLGSWSSCWSWPRSTSGPAFCYGVDRLEQRLNRCELAGRTLGA
jgi:hypothetical protein